jgi:hypothetical protein
VSEWSLRSGGGWARGKGAFSLDGGVDSKAEESLNLLLRGLQAPTELDRGGKAS